MCCLQFYVLQGIFKNVKGDKHFLELHRPNSSACLACRKGERLINDLPYVDFMGLQDSQ